MRHSVFVKSPLPVYEPTIIEIKELNSRIYFGYHEYFKRMVLCYQIMDDKSNNKQTHFSVDVDNWIKNADVCTVPECECDRIDSLVKFIHSESVAYHIMISSDLNNSEKRRQISKDFLDFIYGNEIFGKLFYDAFYDAIPKFIRFAQKQVTTQVR